MRISITQEDIDKAVAAYERSGGCNPLSECVVAQSLIRQGFKRVRVGALFFCFFNESKMRDTYYKLQPPGEEITTMDVEDWKKMEPQDIFATLREE